MARARCLYVSLCVFLLVHYSAGRFAVSCIGARQYLGTLCWDIPESRRHTRMWVPGYYTTGTTGTTLPVLLVLLEGITKRGWRGGGGGGVHPRAAADVHCALVFVHCATAARLQVAVFAGVTVQE